MQRIEKNCYICTVAFPLKPIFIMKHCILFSLFLFFPLFIKAGKVDSLLFATPVSIGETAYAVRTEKTVEPYKTTEYWKKYKRQKRLGYSVLAVGAVIMATGFMLHVVTNWNEPHIDNGFKCVGFVGVGMTASGIPLLTCAYLNRRKAKRISLEAGNIWSPTPGANSKSTPALGLCINF